MMISLESFYLSSKEGGGGGWNYFRISCVKIPLGKSLKVFSISNPKTTANTLKHHILPTFLLLTLITGAPPENNQTTHFLVKLQQFPAPPFPSPFSRYQTTQKPPPFVVINEKLESNNSTHRSEPLETTPTPNSSTQTSHPNNQTHLKQPPNKAPEPFPFPPSTNEPPALAD